MTTSIEALAVAAGVGLLSGTHTAIWGMYKDAIHEGFTALRFSRSIFVGIFCATALEAFFGFPMNTAGSLLLLFGLATAAERGIVEVWKTFIRNEDQSKYFIPMQFTVLGRPVRSRGARMLLGVAYVAGIALVLFAISRLDGDAVPDRKTFALVGFGTGFIIAVSGAWKDAPKEGFEPLKFLRSPLMTLFYTMLLSRVTDSYLLAAAGSIGFERATAETYKTFFFPSKPRGKFSGKPVLYPDMMQRRRYFVPVYVAICAAVIVCGATVVAMPTTELIAAITK